MRFATRSVLARLLYFFPESHRIFPIVMVCYHVSAYVISYFYLGVCSRRTELCRRSFQHDDSYMFVSSKKTDIYSEKSKCVVNASIMLQDSTQQSAEEQMIWVSVRSSISNELTMLCFSGISYSGHTPLNFSRQD